MPKITEDRFLLSFGIAFAIWIVAVLPFLYGPPPRFAESTRPDHSGSAEPNKGTNGEPRGTADAPFFVEVIPSPKSAEERKQETEDREERKSAERGLVNWTAALFAATVGLILATGVLGYFAFRQSRDTKASIDLARQEFNATHRPKIRIKNIWIMEPLTPNRPVVVDVLFVNVGNAPALINNFGIEFNVVDPAAQLLPGNLEPPTAHVDILGRTCGLGFTIRVIGIRSRAPFDAGRVEAILQGRQLLYCFGCVEYLDTGPDETRRIRRTSFYRLFRPFPREVDGMGRFVIPPESERDPDYEYED
jgi:hypothetical protein